jgi:hypothetical protein
MYVCNASLKFSGVSPFVEMTARSSFTCRFLLLTTVYYMILPILLLLCFHPIIITIIIIGPVSIAKRSKACTVYDNLNIEIAVSNPARGMNVCLRVSVFR